MSEVLVSVAFIGGCFLTMGTAMCFFSVIAKSRLVDILARKLDRFTERWLGEDEK